MRSGNKHIQTLCRFLSGFKTPSELELALEDLLTPQELASVAERLRILEALARGTPQRDIAQDMQTSIGKITRGSRIVQYGNLDWKKIASK